MASPSPAFIPELSEPRQAAPAPLSRPRPLDLSMLAGILVALAATAAGIAFTGVRLNYFLQPVGVLIVVGGTLGVTLITTPRRALVHSLQRVAGLLRPRTTDRAALIDEIISFSKLARRKTILGIETEIGQSNHAFLRDALTLAIDARTRDELRATLEMKLRLRERQGDADAKALEVAGGFAPTIGVLGTVVGLIDVLRQFSNLSSVAYGIGTAFVSTIYGLALANLVLLPAANRIRASVADAFETDEMIVEGALGVLDGMHPALLSERLSCFLRESPNR
jgi:chemotaxis protein MotA